MPTRDEIEAWLKGERKVSGGPEAPMHVIEFGDHHYGFPFVTPVGNAIVEVRTGDESVAATLALPWDVPKDCVGVWDYVVRMNAVLNMVRFILVEGGRMAVVAEHPSGDPRSQEYFWETGVCALFAGVFTAAEQTRGEVLELLARCEQQQRDGF